MAVLWFVTGKGLTPKVIQTEPVRVYGPDPFAQMMLKKWPKRFQEGRREFFDDQKPEKCWTHDPVEAICSMFA
jgi:hypothetical protein